MEIILNSLLRAGGIIYNVTIKPEWSIHDEWLTWMKEVHMQQLIDTGCFTSYKLLRMIDVDETDGPTYAAQYFAESKALYNRYIEKYAAVMRDKGLEKWSNKFMTFRSVLQVVH